jgi:two-component system, OmpR family, sensor kinase
MRTVTVPVVRADGTWRVVVGSADRTLDNSEDEVDRVILIAGPLLLVAIAVGSWVLSGAALRPVERMRREVSSLAVEHPRGRVTEPDDVAELAALGRTFNQLLQRLNVSLDRQEGLVADAGHELRTPLAILSVELELADRPDRSAAQLQEAVSHARAEVARLTRLCEDLLLLAGTTPGQAEAEPTRLADLVAESARAHHASLTRHGIELSLIDMDPTAEIDIEPDALRRAIDNLVANAARYCPPRGRISIVTYPSRPRRIRTPRLWSRSKTTARASR